ncbi:hypothetical protein CAPTEDRAFT_175577 [Capitella teleta]|uniref:Uncharacterized protein n=1 Tax=Capitella teleta TaxID=283909 RepID=R7UGV5_CAPTE|nr:hypothetical protein CAPTEDRAFT_175577 [Capitella teleta]|eukprot:ELU03018.1 hypothetical protein CAPTEDRAFT_175577 [Capitella teleta]
MQSVPHDDLDLIHFIVGHGILRKELRDEIYCQLSCQVTNNPSKENTLRGWILFALCAGCFQPSDKLGPFLRSFWREASADYKDYAAYIVRTLRRTSANGMRYHPPNWLEYQATKVKKYVILPVYIPDGSIQSLEADSSTTSSEMIQKIARNLNIKDSFGFSIYICIFDKVSSLGSGLDHVMDAITECEQIVRTKGKVEDVAPWRLYFRKELFTPWHDPELDRIASDLIYKQICKGVKVDEYRFKSEEELSRFAARRLYIEDGSEIIPGKLQSNLHEYLPERALNAGKNREGWTQAILAAFNSQGFSKKLVPQKQVQWHVIATAPRKWPVQFSGLFEATVLDNPILPRTDAVIALSSKGFFVLDDSLNVLIALHFYEIVEVLYQRAHKAKPGTFTILSVKGSEFTCASHNSETIAKILRTFLDGLRRRSRWAVGLQDFTMEDHSDKYSATLNFELGDVIELLNESEINEKTKKADWLYGRCERTKQKGQFPFDAVYVLPTYERPPIKFLDMFVSMSRAETNTLPKKRGVVVISQGTIGRHGGHGIDTSA